MKKLFNLFALITVSLSLSAQGYGNYVSNDDYYYNSNNIQENCQGYLDPSSNSLPQVSYHQTYYNNSPKINYCNPPMPSPNAWPIIYAQIEYGYHHRRPRYIMPVPIPMYYGRGYHYRGGHHRRW